MMIFLPLLDEPAQIARVLGVADRRADLRELLDGVADLLVEDAPVGDDDDRVEDLRLSPLSRPMSWCASQAMEFDLPAAGRVLDQVAPARALVPGIGQQLAHHIELVVAREDLLALLLARSSGPSRSTICA